jgi:hypothetical protein
MNEPTPSRGKLLVVARCNPVMFFAPGSGGIGHRAILAFDHAHELGTIPRTPYPAMYLDGVDATQRIAGRLLPGLAGKFGNFRQV